MKLKWNSVFIFLFIAIIFQVQSNAQGCVAIKHFACSTGTDLETNLLPEGDFQLGLSYRYFKSFRHFRGTEEEADRVANNTEVINNSHALDLNLNYGISSRWFTSLTIPTVINTRSSLYEHGREERNTTFSRGLGDIRVGVGYWVLNPETHQNGNLALGLGLKLPTGDYNATDIFYNVGPEGSPEVRPVDQSIQPGDGGFGFNLNFQLYEKIANRLFGYASGSYLFNPRETNGIRTFRETLSPILENESIMSVADQYSVSAGFAYTIAHNFSGSIGALFEGVPVEDVFGGSGGFRRPGNVLSIDPGISYNRNNVSFNLNVPFAVRRERPQSVTDLETQEATGTPRNGDAAFADYLINVGIAYKIPGRNKTEVPQFKIEN